MSAETLHAHAAPADAAALGEPAYWCGTDRCGGGRNWAAERCGF